MSRLMIVEVPSYSCEFKGIREVCELIRCGECKHFWKYSDLPTKCVFHLSLVNPDDFCSYGVRKEIK